MNINFDLFIEEHILGAVMRLLDEPANYFLRSYNIPIPAIEVCGYPAGECIVPDVVMTACERTEKERLIILDAYTVVITFSVPETAESEMHCYAYAAAVCKALAENPTLGGVADRAVLTGKKYSRPKKALCGEHWEVTLSVRITIEGTAYAG